MVDELNQLQQKLSDLIVQQMLCCDADLRATRAIYDFITQHEPSDTKNKITYINNSQVHFLRYTSNLYFSDALLILSSLLEGSGLPKEQSITLYLITENIKNLQFIEIKKQFDSSGLRDIRNQYIAHKDPRMFTDGHGRIFATFKQKHLEDAEAILIETHKFCETLFTVIANNYIWEKLSPAVSKLLSHIAEDLVEDKSSAI